MQTYTLLQYGRINTVNSICVHGCGVTGCVGVGAIASGFVLWVFVFQVKEVVVIVFLSLLAPLSFRCHLRINH